MRLGTIIALKADKRSGQTIRELDAYDKALAAFKALVAAGVAPLAGHPHAELWTASGRAKSHKFRVDAPPAQYPKIDIEAAIARMEGIADDLNAAEPEDEGEPSSEAPRPRGRPRR